MGVVSATGFQASAYSYAIRFEDSRGTMKFEVISAISLASGSGALIRKSAMAKRIVDFISATSLYSLIWPWCPRFIKTTCASPGILPGSY